jgi:hypothetical protein
MLTLNWGNRLLTGRWLLVAMLALLHDALMLGVDSPWVHPLLLAHLGLFLLWQPLWRGESQAGGSALAFITLAAVTAVFWLNWWVVAFWLTGLFGLVGSRVFAFRDRWTRLLYLTVMSYLLAVLLLWVVPNLFATQSGVDLAQARSGMEVGRLLMWYVLPMLLVIVFFPASTEKIEKVQALDLVYSLLLFMLLAVVILGSLAFMNLGHLDYLDALLRTLFLISLVLLALGGLWNPLFGFSGLQVLFSRYLLNVGTPFENWLTRLADAAQREPDAASYLRRVVDLLADLPWLSGLSWQSPDGAGQTGEFSENSVVAQEGDLRLTLYAKQSLNTAVQLHVHLLTQLIGYFYQAKQREQSLREITRLQAVYETGSRLTHDLKNMLQSLLSLTSIAQSREKSAQLLLQQQLPVLTQRIELTLNKLQQPQNVNESTLVSLHAWWHAVRMRNQHQKIVWNEPENLGDRNIPGALFDCVIDNLLDNVIRKRQVEPDLTISVSIKAEPLLLVVCDNGTAIPETIRRILLRGVVVSENGLGIGLYQAARWAEQLGYHLRLSDNQVGKICFELSG